LTGQIKPLFIPLNGKHFEAFENGTKSVERRVFGPRWNHKTCYIGRPVVLSYGYGKQRRLSGKIVGTLVSATEATRPDFVEIFGPDIAEAMCISIVLDRSTESMEAQNVK